jgi:AmmeMemoRadiSam system protein B
MSLRRRSLPRGWYPEDPEAILGLVSSWSLGNRPLSNPGTALAAVAPHAGWTFSGRLAAVAAASLAPPSTLVVFGGHLPRGSRPLAARETGYETPLGRLEADLELLSALEKALGSSSGGSMALGADEESDNTVEVLLPIVAALFTGVRVLWLRSPNDESSIALGEALFVASAIVGRSVACLGSTDLTHYGPNYGFSPKGRGPAAEAWVREENDRRFIESLLALDGAQALARAESERSACSAGAAVAALAFARAAGANRAELLGYATSLEARGDDSFVGYASIAFAKEPA